MAEPERSVGAPAADLDATGADREAASGDLDARYGRTGSSRRRTRTVGIIAAAAFVAVFAAWLVWAGLLAPAAQFESRDIAHEIVDDKVVRMQWEFSVAPGTPARCALQALNSSFSIVGWKVIDLPPGQERTRQFDETVQTTELATTGLIYRCWLT